MSSQSCSIATPNAAATRGLTARLGALGAWCARTVDRIMTRMEYRREMRALQALSDRSLADIGLSRSDVDRVMHDGKSHHGTRW